jgi:glutamine synthetase
MVRVQGGPGDPGTHLEDRVGEPAANPYLYLAADLAAGLDGIERQLQPPARIEEDPYVAEAKPLPTTLDEALDALDKNTVYREQFGTEFVDYYLMMKRAEASRHRTACEAADDPDDASAAWQMREYFEFY